MVAKDGVPGGDSADKGGHPPIQMIRTREEDMFRRIRFWLKRDSRRMHCRAFCGTCPYFEQCACEMTKEEGEDE